MTSLGFNKKAQAAANIITPVVFLFAFGIVLLIGCLITYAIVNQYQTIYPADANIQTVGNSFKSVYNVFDYGIFLFAIGMIIAIAVTSYRIRSLPVYFVINFIVGLFYCFLAYIFSYIFSQYASNAAFASIITTFDITILLLTNLHWIALFLLLVGSVALYGKRPIEAETLR